MTPPIDPGYLRAVDGIRDELHRHIDDCMKDRDSTRDELRRDREHRDVQHGQNSARLRAIEDAILSVKTGGRLAAWIGRIAWGAFGAMILAGAAKLLSIIR